MAMPDFPIDPELRIPARPPVVLRRTTEAVGFIRKMTLSRPGHAWRDVLQSFERLCGPRFTISLKRSTLIFSYPQAGRPITPSFGAIADIGHCIVPMNYDAIDPICDIDR